MIRLAKAAQADLRNIAEHTKTRFGAAVADRLAREIVATFRRLEHFPHLGRIGRRAGTREIRIAGTPFIVVYKPAQAMIYIVRVIHGAMQWPPGSPKANADR